MVESRPDRFTKFHHVTQNGMQLKIYKITVEPKVQKMKPFTEKGRVL